MESKASLLEQEQMKARQRLKSAGSGDDDTAAVGPLVRMVAERVYHYMRLEFKEVEDKPNLTRVKVLRS